jgi:hypothetical protein
MFFAIILIAVGIVILLNTLGLLNGSFWGFFWAAFFIALGVKVMMRKGKCPMCGWHNFGGKMHNKMHDKMDEGCCGHNHGEEQQ